MKPEVQHIERKNKSSIGQRRPRPRAILWYSSPWVPIQCETRRPQERSLQGKVWNLYRPKMSDYIEQNFVVLLARLVGGGAGINSEINKKL